MPHTYASQFYHIVFATKDRLPSLPHPVRESVYAYLSGVARSEKALLVITGGTADHVHLLIRMSTEYATADVVRSIKANSSRWIHETYPTMRSFAWQRGYGIFTLGAKDRDVVYEYITHQEEHHRATTFEEEFQSMLRESGIEFDPRYLFV